MSINTKFQHGSAMFLSLMILLVLTLLGVLAANSGILQERMAGNFRESARAFQSAESGARWIEAWFASLNDPSMQPFWCFSGACTNTDLVWQVGQRPANMPELDQAWWNANALAFGIDPSTGAQTTSSVNQQATDLSEVASDPRIVIEHVFCRGDTLADCPGGNAVQYYRITSRAVGGRPSSVAVVESTFARRYQ